MVANPSSPAPTAHDALSARRHLAVVAGPDPGWCLAARRTPRTLGRDPSCDLMVADAELSRRHLQVRERAAGLEVRDFGSANGTRLVRPRRLPLRAPGVLRRGLWPGVRLGTRWRRVPVGGILLVGASTVHVRARPGLQREDGRVSSAAGAPGARRPGVAALSGSGAWWPTPLLVAASGLPLLLATGPGAGRLLAVVAVPVVLALALAHRRARTPRPPGPDHADPASVLLAAAAGAQPGQDDEPCSWTVEIGDESLDPFRSGPVALVGDPASTWAMARWIVCRLAVRHAPAAFRVELPPSQLRWSQALPHARASAVATAGRVLAVDDAPLRPPPPSRAAPTAPECVRATLALVRSVDAVPPWCRRVVEVDVGHRQLVSEPWAREVAGTLAQTLAATATPLPRHLPAAGLLVDPSVAWDDPDERLAAVVGASAHGPLEIDLAGDGPHALVAGTTGSGKSELLLCWVLALACRYPPPDLAVVAIDYKGGATFGSLGDLPHLAGVLTDLDAAGTARALAGLSAELRRREAVLASAGARTLGDYRRLRGRRDAPGADLPPLGRLLIVVDEFRVLTDEHPQALAGLVRLAAQGRSLGIHLVLATQRPAGALSADLRANLTVAVCLRVLSAADSTDVVGSADAARLPPVPGRALATGVRNPTGPASLEVQAAWVGGEDDVRAHVAAIRAEAARRGLDPARPLWAPPLPTVARTRGPAATAPAGCEPGSSSVALLVTDRPEEQRLATWSWSPITGPLLLGGGPRTGRTTALQTLSCAALERGWTVHLVVGGDRRLADDTPGLPRHPGLGTVVGADDPRRLVRLLDLLRDSDGPAMVCIDDVDAVLAACDRMHGPPGADRLGRLLHESRARSIGLALAGPAAALRSRWADAARTRVVLGAPDPTDAALLGIPRDLVLARAPAGRGVLLGDGPPALAQVLLPVAPRAAGDIAPSSTTPPRLQPLPVRPDAADQTDPPGPAPRRGPDSGPRSGQPGPIAVPLGPGGDDAAPITLDLSPGSRVVVAGPPESGRTHALALLERALRARSIAVATDPAAPVGDGVLLVDDADHLEPRAVDDLVRHWRGTRGAVVAAVRTERLATGYGPLATLLRDARHVLVLAPLRGGTGHLSPAEVLAHADPALPGHPGRGVLVGPRCALPVQLADVAAEGATEPDDEDVP